MGELLVPQVRDRILARITPTPDEIRNQQQVTDALVQALKRRAETIEQSYSFIEPQGSTGNKQTQLRGAADIDLFVALKPEDYSELLAQPSRERNHSLEDTLDRLVDKWFIPAAKGLHVSKMRKTYSQHPFLSLEMSGLDIDIIGCFDLSANALMQNGPITAVDRTIHHTKYVVEHLSDRIREDVRILKSFVRASHGYGDTSAVGRTGFTGYALELAVIFGGDLGSALDSIRRLEVTPIDPLGRPLAELRAMAAFKDDHVFIIDPTDPRRNVASSFPSRTCKWLSFRIGELLRAVRDNDDERVVDLFSETPIPDEPLPNWLSPHAMAFEFVSDGSVHYTVLRDKLYRTAGNIVTSLERERTGERRFGRALAEVYFERSRFALGVLVESPRISATYPRKGPPKNLEGPSLEFMRSHLEAFERDDYLWVDEPRSWTSAAEFCLAMLEASPIQGLSPARRRSAVSARTLNALYRYILPLETGFRLEGEEGFKGPDSGHSL